jgi:hypothetical protein
MPREALIQHTWQLTYATIAATAQEHPGTPFDRNRAALFLDMPNASAASPLSCLFSEEVIEGLEDGPLTHRARSVGALKQQLVGALGLADR